MRVFLVLCVSFLILSETVSAAVIRVQCVSTSGQSVYDLELNPQNQSGEIRYRFMGQDVFYSVRLNSTDRNLLTGIAEFKGSLSGEVRGTPFAFTYDAVTKKFTELNIRASCE